MNPLAPAEYQSLVWNANSVCDELVSIYRANYVTAYQLALDCNLPGPVREEYRSTARLAGFFLRSRLGHILGDSPFLPPVDF